MIGPVWLSHILLDRDSYKKTVGEFKIKKNNTKENRTLFNVQGFQASIMKITLLVSVATY